MVTFQLLFALISTIIIEGSIAYLIGVKNLKDQLYILCINCITNISINIILLLFGLIGNQILNIIIMSILEIIVLFVEWIMFKKLLCTTINKFRLSLIINLISCLFGVALSLII